MLYLFLGSGLAYSGGVYLALKFDNFHDFFTEYVPYGEEVVLYFEERDFYRRFPNATRHHAPAKERQEAQRVTIPGKSGLSSRVAEEEETTGSDLTKKGPHNSATEPHSKSEKVVKMKEDRASRQQEKKEAPKPTPQEAPKQETPKEEPKQPASTPASALQLVDVKDEEDPVVQELARVFNDIVKVISADGTGDKHADGVAKARSEIESIGKKITALRADAQRQAEDEIKKAHEEFDKSAREMIRRIDEARAAEILQYQQEFETEHERLSRAYQEKLKVELEREKELAEQRLKNQLVEQAIELNRKFLLDVHDLVERERAGRLGKINELTANVQELEKLTSEWSEVIDSNLKTQQLQVAIDAVRTVLESADGPRPFVRELIAVKELAADNPVVSAAIASINPSAYQRGIPTNAQIIDRFRRVANEVRKASLLPEDAGIASHAASVVLNKVMFKKDVAADGDDVESILVRTENLLEEGNLDAAAREMNSLQGWAKILSKDWLADVRRVLEVKQAIEVRKRPGNHRLATHVGLLTFTAGH